MKLKDYVALTGLKSNFLAKKFGISPQYFSLLKQGRVTPSLQLAFLIEKETQGKVKVHDWQYRETIKLQIRQTPTLQ